MKTKECHWDTAFVSCIGSPMNNREPCGRARVLGRTTDTEREREREKGVRWGLDWSQSNVRHHYQHQPTNHHHHQPIAKILINNKKNRSHETLASLKIRTVVYMDSCLHGQLFTWTVVFMDICLHGQLFSWTVVYMDSCLHGQLFTWTVVYMDSCLHGHLFTWTVVYMDSCLHGQLFTWKDLTVVIGWLVDLFDCFFYFVWFLSCLLCLFFFNLQQCMFDHVFMNCRVLVKANVCDTMWVGWSSDLIVNWGKEYRSSLPLILLIIIIIILSVYVNKILIIKD